MNVEGERHDVRNVCRFGKLSEITLVPFVDFLKLTHCGLDRELIDSPPSIINDPLGTNTEPNGE